MGFFNLFGSSVATPAIEEYLDKGAVVIDVITIAEFVEGHVEGSDQSLSHSGLSFFH